MMENELAGCIQRIGNMGWLRCIETAKKKCVIL
jgi:hypothetical protein